jgi:hypothetical protein
MQELLTRLDKKGTPAYISRFAKFYHFVSANDDKGLGTDFYVRIAEEVLAGSVNGTYPGKLYKLYMLMRYVQDFHNNISHLHLTRDTKACPSTGQEDGGYFTHKIPCQLPCIHGNLRQEGMGINLQYSLRASCQPPCSAYNRGCHR